ncbi:pentapeptide repeat-containing protein [Halomonas sp. ATCH28]|uniref:Pentapeptide repeat-containing protein n=1 Tax=Halomonas gemina TaxID=2945105 RepID=A0ABT0SW83_9GAMM|nr:pentapeptide repeat-containing protein [Halomonas gemina]MCL7938843.1 pentapeptide repeat-containing protein [Halomonas gemina]
MTEREQQQVARINELSALARTSWLALLAYLGYIGITLLAVQDADFFVPSRQTELPLVGIAIPTFSFFVFAPPLGAALYIYLHIHLLKLCDALAAAPARIDGEALADRIHPWLANDLFLTMRADGAASSRPLRGLSNLASRLLVWVAAPLVLAGFWWRSMPAHEEWLTLFLALNLLIAIYTGLSSWWSARSAFCRTFRRPWPNPWRGRWHRRAGLAAALAIMAISWLRTEGGVDHYVNRVIDFAEVLIGIPLFDNGTYPNGDPKSAQVVQEEWVASRIWIPNLATFSLDDDHWLAYRWLYDVRMAWTPLARTDLTGVELVELPESWRTAETARADFRERWCRREGLSMEDCGHLISVDRPPLLTLAATRAKWCTEFPDIPANDCLAWFDTLDQRFANDWDEERKAKLANLPKLELAKRDLRRVNAYGATLVNADLWRTRLQGATLVGARLEGANLIGARLEGADLSHARLEGADLSWAQLKGARLGSARLEGANLEWARLEHVDLSEARLHGAKLREVRLVGAYLTRARLDGAKLFGAQLEGAHLDHAQLEGAQLLGSRLEGADLFGARLEGADLRWARLQGARLEGADLRWAVLHTADLRGAQGLTQVQLDGVIGNADTLLPEGTDTGEAYYIWNCWEQPPPNFQGTVATWGGSVETDEGEHLLLREAALCGNRPRERTGTPLAQDAPYPEGHPIAGSDQH